MIRAGLVLVLGAMLIGGWVLAPGATGPTGDDPGLEPAAASAAVCPVRIDRTVDGKLTAGSTVLAPLRVTVASGGSVTADFDVDPESAGGAAVQFADLTIGGAAGAFVEFPIESAAAASVSRGDAGVTAAACSALIRTSSMIVGPSTRNGESLELVLVNPYGSDAVVAVESSSEIGSDSVDVLSSVVVPARSTVTRDLSSVLPLRSRLSLTIVPLRGLVHAFTDGGGRGDRVVVEHVEPSAEWTVPIVSFEEQTASLVIATVSPVEVAVRLDGWADGEFVEGVVSEVLPARGQLEIPLDDLGLDIAEVRADGPIAVSLVVDGEAGRAATPANPATALEWLMPGPGSAGSVAWVGVPGDLAAVVEFLSLSNDGESFTVEVPPGTTVGVPLDAQPIGYTVRADSPVSIVWSVSDATGIGLGTPTPVPGGE